MTQKTVDVTDRASCCRIYAELSFLFLKLFSALAVACYLFLILLLGAKLPYYPGCSLFNLVQLLVYFASNTFFKRSLPDPLLDNFDRDVCIVVGKLFDFYLSYKFFTQII